MIYAPQNAKTPLIISEIKKPTVLKGFTTFYLKNSFTHFTTSISEAYLLMPYESIICSLSMKSCLAK